MYAQMSRLTLIKMLQYERAEIMHGPSAVSEADETTETAFGDNLFYLINVAYKNVIFN